MTRLLDDAMARARTLAPEKQDEIAWVVFDFIGSQEVDLARLPADYRDIIQASLIEGNAKGTSLPPGGVRALYRSLL